MLRQPVSQEMATLAALPGQKSHQANSCIARSSSIEPMDVPRQFKKKKQIGHGGTGWKSQFASIDFLSPLFPHAAVSKGLR